MDKLKTKLAYSVGAVIGVLLYVLGAFIFAQSMSNEKSSSPFALFIIVLILMTAALFYSAIGLLLKADNLFGAIIAAVIQVMIGGGILMSIFRSQFLPDDTLTMIYYCLAAFAPLLFGAIVFVGTVIVRIIKIVKK